MFTGLSNPPELSQFGEKMTKLSGVRAIMKDINETLAQNQGAKLINLSPGNPLILPKIEALWRNYTEEMLKSGEYGEVVCRYGGSRGYQPLIDAVVEYFNQKYGLGISAKNVLITPGSQALYFYAVNAFCGYTKSGVLKKMVLPLVPDYTGYGGISLYEEAVTSFKPKMTINETEHSFKYHADFEALKIDETTGCVLFSRPCNPTGNILSTEEVQHISRLAEEFNVPVFVDSAYAAPFPGLNFTDMNLVFGKNIVHCISLSKVGLPGERVGIAIGDEQIIEVLESFMTNSCIHSSRYGQALAAKAMSSGSLENLADEVIRPFYKQKSELLQKLAKQYFSPDLPYYLHKTEGSMFGWMWFKDLPVTDWELYKKLKEQKVILVPGSTFFPGLNEPDWKHQRECLRISLTASDEDLEEGIKILSEVVKWEYSL